MKAMFDVKRFGATGRMKVLAFLMLCTVWAMVWVFVQVERQAGMDRVRLADVNEQLVLSQRLAKYALNAAGGDADAFGKMDALKKRFATIIDGQIADLGGAGGTSDSAEYQALVGLQRRWQTFRASIDDVLEERLLMPAMATQLNAQSEQLFNDASRLKRAIEAASENRPVSSEQAYLLGAVALFLLFWMAFEAVRGQRVRSRLIEDENRRNQEAILRLLDEMGGLAAGDLTVSATVSEDFTGAIADSVNVTVGSLRGLVKTINDTSRQLSSSVQQTEAVANQLSRASNQQSRDITDAGTAIKEMTESMNEVSREANESSKVAMRSVEIARKGGSIVQRNMEGMDTIRDHIQETSKRIKRLGESSQEIGDIVELINDIAEQTNILALNASIQAAMAGEAGRGFAVVADEVQRLAERSANATRQIEALVKTIQADTNEAVISMEKSTAGVVDGAQLAEDAGSALEEIESVSDQLAGLIQNISVAARKQANAAADLSKTMQGIQEMTTQATSGTEMTSRSIGNLARLAQDLDTTVAGFKLPE
ncbi:MAG: methyl-accepting chemotaxis protein [Gammaproteobacteria bacterium]|jgi:twitching motility protein PilJ